MAVKSALADEWHAIQGTHKCLVSFLPARTNPIEQFPTRAPVPSLIQYRPRLGHRALFVQFISAAATAKTKERPHAVASEQTMTSGHLFIKRDLWIRHMFLTSLAESAVDKRSDPLMDSFIPLDGITTKLTEPAIVLLDLAKSNRSVYTAARHAVSCDHAAQRRATDCGVDGGAA